MVVFTFVCSWLFVSCAVIFGVRIFALAMELTILYVVGEPLFRTALMLLSLSVGSPIRLAWWFLSSCKMTFVFGVRVDATIFYWKIDMVFDLYLRHLLVLVFFISWCPIIHLSPSSVLLGGISIIALPLIVSLCCPSLLQFILSAGNWWSKPDFDPPAFCV